MWDAFARRGMGVERPHADADNDEPKPSFASPTGTDRPVTFAHHRRGHGSTSATTRPASTPVADTVRQPKLDADRRPSPRAATRCSCVSPSRGFKRFTLTVHGRRRPHRADDRRHAATWPRGRQRRKVIGASAGSLNADVAHRRHRDHQLGRRHATGNVDETQPVRRRSTSPASVSTVAGSRSARC